MNSKVSTFITLFTIKIVSKQRYYSSFFIAFQGTTSGFALVIIVMHFKYVEVILKKNSSMESIATENNVALHLKSDQTVMMMLQNLTPQLFRVQWCQ